MLITVGISDMKLSAERDALIVTHSLGSCIGVTLFDPERGVGGMIHCMLPLSSQSPQNAAAKPCMYVDTGLSLLIQQVFELGARRASLIAKVAGASVMLDDKNLFRIGERNLAVTRKVLWKNDILIAGQDTGDCKPRTMRLYLKDGRTTVKTGAEEKDI